MTDLPAPLTPPDCDLRGYDFMPLHGHRLFNSDFYYGVSADAFRAGLRLWWAAWQQSPAASLPDDDTTLCRLADMGRDMKGWKALRAEALRGFVRCSDGRLYHPVIAELALEAWDRRRKERARKAAFRAGRQGRDADSPRDNDAASADAGSDNGDVSADNPLGQSSTRARRQDRTGQDRKKRVPFASLTAPAEPSRAPPPEPDHPLWPVCRDRIGMHPAEFRSWFRDAELDTSNGHPVLTLPTRFAADHVRGQWGPALTRELGDGIEIAAAQPEAGPPGIRDTLWTEGLARLRRLTGKPDKAARTLLGQFCRDAGDDCALVSGLLFDAERDRPGDPVAWLSAAIQRRGASGNGHAGRQRDGTLAWIFDDATTGGTT